MTTGAPRQMSGGLTVPPANRNLAKASLRVHSRSMVDVQTSAGVIGVSVAGDLRTPILFLHGVGSDKSVWRRQLDHFGANRPAVAIDYPGYGESALQPGASRDDFARSAWAALDALGIHRAHICGLSLGGVVAIAMHAAQPDRCASLILADSFAVHPQGQAIFDRSTAASENMRAVAESRIGALLVSADPAIHSEVIETMAAIDPEAYRIGARAVWLADQRDRAAEIRVPTLIIVGDEDQITPRALSDELVGLIPGSGLAVIEGASHLANLDKPDAFNAVIDEFLSALKGEA